MELITKTLFLCLALALTNGAPTDPQHSTAGGAPHAAMPDRCEGIEFDAITLDRQGNTLFFKGCHLWKGFHGSVQLSNESFKELDDIHHLGHVDAAFRMHNKEDLDDHDHVYFFQDDKVFKYDNDTLEDGYPKEIQKDFPGVPSHLDAAVECPKGECITDSVLFFKGNDVYVYDTATKTLKTKKWSHLPVCTSALRWAEHYYCFHGHNFTRFNPITGEVSGTYPKDTRNYFMKCDRFGGFWRKVEFGSSLFSDSIYMRLDTQHEGLHAFPIVRAWKEMTNGVDAVFSVTDKIYLIKGDQVYIYKTTAQYTLIEGYPKSLKEELGIEGHVDAAFVCPNEHTLHIIQGQTIRDVDLNATPRVVTRELPLPFPHVDAALCRPQGVDVFEGSQYYHYENVLIMAMSRMAPVPLDITPAMMGCIE